MDQFQQEELNTSSKNKFTAPPNGQENVRPPPRPMRPPPQGIVQQEANIGLINSRPPMSPQNQPSQIIMQNGNNQMRPQNINSQPQFRPPIPNNNIPQNHPNQGQAIRPPMSTIARPPPLSILNNLQSSSVNQNQTIKPPTFHVSNNIQQTARPPLESTSSGPSLNRLPLFQESSNLNLPNQRPHMPNLRPPMPNLNSQRPPVNMSIPSSILQSPIDNKTGSSAIKPPVPISSDPMIRPPFPTQTQPRPPMSNQVPFRPPSTVNQSIAPSRPISPSQSSFHPSTPSESSLRLAVPIQAHFRPPMPNQASLRPPMPSQAPHVPNQAPFTSMIKPDFFGSNMSNQSPLRPPIPQSAQGAPVSQSSLRPPTPQSAFRPPMPQTAQGSPVTQSALRPPTPQSALRPPMPQTMSGPPRPFRAPQPLTQNGPPRPPLSHPVQNQQVPMRPPHFPGQTSGYQSPPIPSLGHQTSNATYPPTGPPMVPQVSQVPSIPQFSPNTGFPGSQSRLDSSIGHGPNQEQQQAYGTAQQNYQFPQNSFPQQQQSHQGASAGYSTQGYPQAHPNQTPGSIPQSISATSHSMKEFYEPIETRINPNITSEYLTCSLGKIPRNATILGKCRTPFGLTVSFYPFGDVEKDRVDEVTGPIVRCRRCRTYLNPFVEVIEQGSRWRCNLCYLANEFPAGYDYDPVSQKPIDRKDHPELTSFVYDFTNAPIEYTVRPPQPPVFLFALEVTAAAVQSGLLASSCRVIQEQLDAIPNEDGRARVALLTFDQKIQFYKMSPNEPNARVLVVADLREPFLPACSDLLVNLAECRSQFDNLLEQLPSMYATPSKFSPALGPVLQCAQMLLKSIGGKIVVICASLPTQFEGALKARDDQKLLGTVKESTLLQPANQFYKLLASEVVKDQICIDLFVAPPQISAHLSSYVDLATLSGLTKYTGGKLNYYPEFGAGDAISSKFCADLRRFLGQAHGFEAVLRIRASQGISLSAYHGSFFLRQTDLLSLPNVNPDHSFTAQACIDENLPGAVVCFQAALLHTTSTGERRIRVINFSAPVTDDVKEVFDNMNVNGIAGVLSKMAVEKVLANRLEDAREAVLNKCSDIIAAYKSLNGLKTNQSLLLCENLKNLPIFLNSLIKSIVLRSGSGTHPDLRSYHLTNLKTLSAIEIIGLLLPRFYAIHAMDSECGIDGKLPNLLNLSSERLERHGIFLLDNGFQQFLWLGSNVHPELCSLLFGTQNLAQIPSGRTTHIIPDLDNDWNRRVRAISETLRSRFAKNLQPEFFVIKEESEPTIRQLFLSNLVEDRSIDGSAVSYAQWLMEVTTRANTSSY